MGGRVFGSTDQMTSLDQIVTRAKLGGAGSLTCAPLMHGAAQWAAYNMITMGGRIVIPDDVERLRAGDVLRLDVQAHWFYPRDPVRGQLPTGYQRSGAGVCLIHCGPEHPSSLLLGRRPTSVTDARALP